MLLPCLALSIYVVDRNNSKSLDGDCFHLFLLPLILKDIERSFQFLLRNYACAEIQSNTSRII